MIEFMYAVDGGQAVLTVRLDRISGVGTEPKPGGYTRYYVLAEGQRFYTTAEEAARVGRLLG